MDKLKDTLNSASGTAKEQVDNVYNQGKWWNDHS